MFKASAFELGCVRVRAYQGEGARGVHNHIGDLMWGCKP